MRIKTINKNYIPDITHPLGKGWNQPSRKGILIDDTHAVMDQKTFDALANYSHSIPTGVYEGKMWKGEFSEGGWYLRWFGLSDIPDKVSTNQRIILIL